MTANPGEGLPVCPVETCNDLLGRIGTAQMIESHRRPGQVPGADALKVTTVSCNAVRALLSSASRREAFAAAGMPAYDAHECPYPYLEADPERAKIAGVTA